MSDIPAWQKIVQLKKTRKNLTVLCVITFWAGLAIAGLWAVFWFFAAMLGAGWGASLDPFGGLLLLIFIVSMISLAAAIISLIIIIIISIRLVKLKNSN